MKIAIASDKDDENSQVSEKSGRARYYLIFEDKKYLKTIKNPFAIGGGGAGLGVAQMLKNEDVGLIISGNFGEKMELALKDKEVLLMISDKTVTQALEEVLR